MSRIGNVDSQLVLLVGSIQTRELFMSGEFESLQLPACFTGVVRLFPLPNLVLFRVSSSRCIFLSRAVGRWWKALSRQMN